MYEISYR